jgi:hypothetical protein
VVPPVDPNDRSTEVVLTPKNVLRILNTINPVTRACTVIDRAKLVKVIGNIQSA